MNHEHLLRDVDTNVYYFNPKKLIIKNRIINRPIFRKITNRRLNNFGDLLGPIITKEILLKRNIKGKFIQNNIKFLTIGSIIHFANDNDHIWGSGINGKVKSNLTFNNLNIHSVRGPLTKDILTKKGLKVPEIYGDPGILFGYFFPEYKNLKKKRKYLFIPNYNDKNFYKNNLGIKVTLPIYPLKIILKDIAESEIIITSSLHGIVLADSLDIDCIILKSYSEDQFKYKDYLFGTGRDKFSWALTLSDALKSQPIEKCKIDHIKLLDTFPYNLYAY